MPTVFWGGENMMHLTGDATAPNTVLLPGYNQCTPETVKFLTTHSWTKRWMKGGGGGRDMEGKLRIEGVDLSETDKWAMLPENDALAVAENTQDESLLRGWLQVEKRPNVVKGIQKQLDILDPTKPDTHLPVKAPAPELPKEEVDLGHFNAESPTGKKKP